MGGILFGNRISKMKIAIKNKSIGTSEHNLFSSEFISDNFKQMSNKKELSLILNEDPKIILINLPAGFKGKGEMHENEDDIYLIFEGKAELIIEKKRTTIKKADIIHIPSRQFHKLDHTKNGIKYMVIKIKK